MSQTAFTFDAPLPAHLEKHRAAFVTYHAANPHVYEKFKEYAFLAIDAGMTKYSARAIVHLIRWHYVVEMRRTDEFKINNNHSPFYGRLFMEDHPQHVGFFELRTSVADEEA